MSDGIQVTVVTAVDGKLNNGMYDSAMTREGEAVIVTHDSSRTLMSTLLQNGLISGNFCGGRGDCGRCRIQFMKGITLPTPLERSVMEPEELRQGYRLACLSKPKSDCVIRLALAEEPEIEIVSEMTDLSGDNDYISQQKKQTENRKTSDMKSDHLQSAENKEDQKYVIAADLGTTTIAMQLCDALTGRAVDTYCEMNPQRSYGADVLSRIQASCAGHSEAMQKMAWGVLERGMAQFGRKLAGMTYEMTDVTECARKIVRMCIAGNTAMEHLLLGYDVSSLGVSPFTPVEIGLQEIVREGFPMPVCLAPGISAFVGGDIVAGLYALDMLGGCRTDKREEKPEGVRLLIDLGTNGEMAITDGRRMIVTATAAGPAFEGGAGARIIGTDMIAITAAMLEQGIIDETGLLAEAYFETGVTVPWKDTSVYMRNQDIRNLQLAKAAVRAGVELLWEAMGRPAVERVYLAGGFGYYLDVEAAFRIGLLPERLRGRVQAVGNASLAGACRLGCDLCQKRVDRKALGERLAAAESMNLAKQENFEKLYIKYMGLSPD